MQTRRFDGEVWPANRLEDDYQVDVGALGTELEKEYDLCVIVNPNNPTGRHIPRADLEDMLKRVPAETTV